MATGQSRMLTAGIVRPPNNGNAADADSPLRALSARLIAGTLGAHTMEPFFSCHPPASKCEWRAAVRDFALEFNRLRGADYVRETCFDSSPSTARIPEVRLVSATQPSMVVERKTIVWPKQFLYRHSHWHRLVELLVRGLEQLLEGPHSVALNCENLSGLSSRDVDRIGANIVQQVGAGSSSGLAVGPKGGRAIPWQIHRGLFDAPTGVKIEVLDWPGQSFPEPDEFIERREKALLGFRHELENCLVEVEEKLDRFVGHYKVLLVQFIGDAMCLDEEADLVAIVEPAQRASFIDEVWVASKEWVSEEDFDIMWVPAPMST